MEKLKYYDFRILHRTSGPLQLSNTDLYYQLKLSQSSLSL